VLRSWNPVLATLLTTSTVVTLALGWFGWRNLEQESTFERQRARERIETGADAIAAGIRGRLAEAGDRLSGWITSPGSPAPAHEGSVVVTAGEQEMEVVPRGALPFVPRLTPIPAPHVAFAEAEAMEFAGAQPARAAEHYRKLSQRGDPRVRAEALLRLGRTLRKARNFDGAMEAFQSLARTGDVLAGDLPAELAGLDGQRLTRAAAGNQAGERQLAVQMAQFIDEGRWLLPRGPAEFYRELGGRQPKPESWILAEALASLWEAEDEARPSAGRIRVIEVEGRPVLTIWRSNGARSAALASFADRFVTQNVPAGYAYQLTNAAEQRLAGAPSAPPETVARIIGDPQNPWLLRLWPDGAVSAEGSRLGPRLLLAILAIAILFLWGTVYFMARAIRREAAVSRLQSDFVAAVSHEFRSPLTTVRQLAEMLEMDQVPSEDRRRKYYQVLAAEARRLQRLVETLLNFGKMEAGAQQYHFERLDVSELVRRAVSEAAIQEDVASSRVRISGPPAEVHLIGDGDALSLALRNLVENGLKYSPDSEVVEVKWNHQRGRVLISIVDHGPGIPGEEHEAIFHKFVRGRAAIEASIKGTGVGLAMVRQILYAHGGEIRLESEPGRGSTFTVVLTEAN